LPFEILCENRFNLKTIFKAILATRENNQIILSKVAEIALNIVFKLKRFLHKMWRCPCKGTQERASSSNL